MQQTSVEFAFLIIYYNQEQYVDRSLQSVLQQKTTFPFKILIGDDGSQDGTVQKIKDWQAKYPEIISYYVMPRDLHKQYNPHHRSSDLRLFLLKQWTEISTGGGVENSYFCMLDGDDEYISSDFAEIGVQTLQQYPQTIGCSFNFLFANSGEQRQAFAVRPFEGLYDFHSYIKANLYIHASSIVFRNFLPQMQQSQFLAKLEQVHGFVDVGLVCDALFYGPLIYQHSLAFQYNIDTGGIWSRKSAIEQDVSYVMVCEAQSFLFPKFKYLFWQKYLYKVKKVFRQRRQLKDLLTDEQIAKSVSAMQDCNTYIAYDLFQYARLSFFRKIWLYYRYKSLEVRCAFYRLWSRIFHFHKV